MYTKDKPDVYKLRIPKMNLVFTHTQDLKKIKVNMYKGIPFSQIIVSKKYRN